MKFLSVATTSTSSFTVVCRRCARLSQCRYPFQTVRHNASLSGQIPSGKLGAEKLTFERIGLPKPLVSSLQKAFPEVREPTQIQSEFIPAILSGRDVLLKDPTGTGKSFGLVLALLAKRRQFKDRFAKEAGKQQKPLITSLVLVPHTNLAYQLFHWIQSIHEVGNNPPESLPSIVQLLVREHGDPNLYAEAVNKRLAALKESPPHILIGTPQTVWDVYSRPKTKLSGRLSHLSSVVVDEVDWSVDYIPKKARGHTRDAIARKMEKHSAPAQELLDAIVGPERTVQREKPQLVVASATLNRGMLDQVMESGWLSDVVGQVVRIQGDLSSMSRPRHSGDEEGIVEDEGAPQEDVSSRVDERVLNSVLVVHRDGSIKNIEGAIEAPALTTTSGEEASNEDVLDDDFITASFYNIDEPQTHEIDERVREKIVDTPSPYNPVILEAIATAFALDVFRLALLVIPNDLSVDRAVFELREMAVNAQTTDFSSDDARKHLIHRARHDVSEGIPTLLVTRQGSVRGLDIPDLTHVFIYGVPKGRPDVYVHAAGRVGRFGRGGKVITVCEEQEELELDDGRTVTARNDPAKMRALFKILGIVARKFEHFE